MTTHGPISEGSKNSSGAGCAVVVGLIFALVGFGVLGGAIYGAFHAIEVQTWPESPCKILTASMDESHSDDGTSYRADFTFEYEVEGVKFVGERDRAFKSFGSRKAAKNQLALLPVGTETVCHVNPEDPADAVLDASFPWWSIGGFSVFGAVFALVGSSVAYVSLRSVRASKRRQAAQRSSSAGRSSLAVSGQAGGYFHTDVIDREHDPENRYRAGGGVSEPGHEPTHLQGQLGKRVYQADSDDREADVPQRLKSESSRWGTLLGAIFIALFWNGIVSALVCGVLSDGPGIFASWAIGLFLVPFVLIGLVLIAAVIHSFIALFNPTVSIALSSGAVSRGGTLDVAWEVSSGLRNIDRLTISVVGTEWAQYQRGTDTITDELTFEIVPVLSTDRPDEIKFGSGTIRIPVETMHTLDLDNNKIKWTVLVNGSIAWWPDVTNRFPFRVTPYQVAAEYPTAAPVEGVNDD